jgi:hypothetical protein
MRCEYRCYSFHQRMDIENLGHNACYEIHEDLIYYIQGKVRAVPQPGIC